MYRHIIMVGGSSSIEFVPKPDDYVNLIVVTFVGEVTIVVLTQKQMLTDEEFVTVLASARYSAGQDRLPFQSLEMARCWVEWFHALDQQLRAAGRNPIRRVQEGEVRTAIVQ